MIPLPLDTHVLICFWLLVTVLKVIGCDGFTITSGKRIFSLYSTYKQKHCLFSCLNTTDTSLVSIESIRNVFQRRHVLSSIISSCSILTSSLPSDAQQDLFFSDTRRSLNQAVTESDLGISVRRSVVRGAQIFDKVDQKWEQFSDTFHLGSQRGQTMERPQPKLIPPGKPIQSNIAQKYIQTSDQVFLSLLLSISPESLASKIQQIDSVVQKSFGLKSVTNMEINWDENGEGVFNYLSYLHFKAYCQLLLNININFSSFRTAFEDILGEKLLLFLVEPSSGRWIDFSKVSTLQQRLQTSYNLIDMVLNKLVNNGFIAVGERSSVTQDVVDDWIDGIAPCSFTISLDGDATLQSQVLLQEQGFRLYPNYCKFMVQALLERIFQGSNQNVVVEEYYMDTNYNSDPDLYDAKQVLLNILIEERS